MIVTPDLFRGPLGGLAFASRWMPERVRHDGGGVKARGRTSPVAWGKRGCDRRGSASSSAAGRDCVLAGALSPRRRPQPCQWCDVQRGVAAVFVSGGSKEPLEVSLQHRPGPPHTMPTRSRGICRGLPLNVVRIAPVHDAGITARPKPRAEICTLWAKLRSHACRGASRRSCPLA